MFRDKVFKKRLFGYSKIDVIDYLNILSQDFSKRLTEQEENSKKEIANYQEKIEHLELEKKDLIDKQTLVMDILMDAEKYNSSIKKSLEFEAHNSYENLQRKVKHETERLNDYKKDIDKLRTVSQDMLGKIIVELDLADIEIDIIQIPSFEEFIAGLDNKTID